MNNKNTSDFIKKMPGRRFDVIDVLPHVNSSGDLKEVKDAAAIVNAIMNVLYIQKGTYIADPEYGVGLHTYLFEPVDRITEEAIKGELAQITRIYEDHATIRTEVAFFNDMKGFRIFITVEKDGLARRGHIDINETTTMVN